MIKSVFTFPVQGKAILFFTAIIFLTAACSKEKQTADAPEKYPVIIPVMTDTLYSSEYVAEIQSMQNIDLRAKVSGYLERIHVDEGAFVRKGQILFSIGSQEYREELTQAQAMLKSARADAKVAEVDVINVKRLVEKKIVSQTELEIAQSKYDAFLAKIDEAKAFQSSASLKLSYAEIRAPFDGIIDRIPNKQGSLINEGDLLTTLSDNKEVFAYFNVSESEYLDQMMSKESGRSTEVELVLANGKVYSHKGMIETVESTIDKNTGNIAFRARFKNPEGIIKHGSSGKIKLNRLIKDAIMIPQKTTFEIQENTYVYVVDKDNVVHMKSITPKVRMSNIYLIEAGLTPNDKIIYEGIQRVRDGDKVSVSEVQFRPVLARVSRQ
jgi:RND family efflux transporter MFP subunit